MAKIKDIIGVLTTYEKITQLVGGEELEGIKEFTAVLKNYRQIEISAFEQKLVEGQKKKDPTLSPKNPITTIKYGMGCLTTGIEFTAFFIFIYFPPYLLFHQS